MWWWAHAWHWVIYLYSSFHSKACSVRDIKIQIPTATHPTARLCGQAVESKLESASSDRTRRFSALRRHLWELPKWNAQETLRSGSESWWAYEWAWQETASQTVVDVPISLLESSPIEPTDNSGTIQPCDTPRVWEGNKKPRGGSWPPITWCTSIRRGDLRGCHMPEDA